MSKCYRPGGMHYPFNGEFNLNYEDEWNTMSVYEKLCYIKGFYDEVKLKLENVLGQLAAKEDSDNITNVRLLSDDGDFTGTLANKLKTALQVVQGIDNNRDQIQYLTGQFSDGQTGLVIDGGFFEETGINKNYDGGVF